MQSSSRSQTKKPDKRTRESTGSSSNDEKSKRMHSSTRSSLKKVCKAHDDVVDCNVASQIFSIIEILERILLHVPGEVIVTVARLVNRTFRDTIEQSTKIQHATFNPLAAESKPIKFLHINEQSIASPKKQTKTLELSCKMSVAMPEMAMLRSIFYHSILDISSTTFNTLVQDEALMNKFVTEPAYNRRLRIRVALTHGVNVDQHSKFKCVVARTDGLRVKDVVRKIDNLIGFSEPGAGKSWRLSVCPKYWDDR